MNVKIKPAAKAEVRTELRELADIRESQRRAKIEVVFRSELGVDWEGVLLEKVAA